MVPSAARSRAATALASISLLLAIHLIGYHSCGFVHFADSSEMHSSVVGMAESDKLTRK